MRQLFIYAPVIYRNPGKYIRLERLAEQAVSAVFISMALSPFIKTAELSYAGFLLLGLAPWYYFCEILTDLPEQVAAFSSIAPRRAFSAFRAPLCQAVAALPTLLLWSAAAVAVCGLTGAWLKNPLLFFYALFCNIYNAIAQGLLLSAFTPLLKGASPAKGLSVTLPFLFWSTPLAWPYAAQSPLLNLMMQANPLYYISECYRLSFRAAQPTTEQTLIFFLATLTIGALGYALTKRVRRRAF